MKPDGSGPESGPEMDRAQPTETAERPAPIGEDRKTIGLVETDRYCEECGFNLRGQHVFRDGGSRLVLVRCSECGTLHPANSLTTNARGAWFRRLAGVLLLGWVVFVLWLLFVAGVVEVAVQIATSEVLDLNRPVSDVMELAARNAVELGWYAFLSLAVPFVCLTLLTVVCHHWRRFGYLAAAVLLPLVPGLLVRVVAREDFPDTAYRMTPFFAAHLGLQVIGGLAGATLGRPAARLFSTLFVPPRARQALGFLWLADGKAPPRLKRPAGNGASD